MNRGKQVVMVIAVAVSAVVLFSFYLIYQSGVISGLSEEIDIEVKKAKAQEGSWYFYNEGIIYDRNGNPITKKEKPDDRFAVMIYPAAYNFLGYANEKYGLSDLRNKYRELLFTEQGSSFTLTTDNALQQYTYDLLGRQKGCIVVLDNASGAILALAQRPDKELEYNVNEVDEKFDDYDSKDTCFLNHALMKDTPGSVFKAVTATSMVENQLEDYTYDDKNGDYKGIHNAYGGYHIEDVDLEVALIDSCNTYFASAAVEKLGGKKLMNTANKFQIGMDPIELDIGTLNSVCDMSYFEDDRLIADCAYGQGRTEISPLQLAMIFATISNNDGKLLRPHIIDKIICGNTPVFQYSDTTTIKTDLDSKTLETVKQKLHAVAISSEYNFTEDKYGEDMIAKTGTAENGKDGYHIYLATSNSRFTVMISIEETNESSYDLMPLAKSIYDYLIKNDF